jgi:O-antigen/teichoic acid export membrane protein
LALTESERTGRGLSPAALVGRAKAWIADGSDRGLAQRVAGAAFLIRVASAGMIYLTQILLARWMGRFEFGVYVYVWSWVGFLGMLSPLGIAYSAQRFIPEYRTRGDRERLHGFLLGSRWLCFVLGLATAAAMATTIVLLGDRVPAYYFAPFMAAAIGLPIFTLSAAQDAIARSFNWIELALIPGFIVLPLIIFVSVGALHFGGVPVTALVTLIVASAALWIVVLMQLVLLGRRLKRELKPAPRRYEIAGWLKTALPIFLVDSFFILLTYVDILVLQLFVGPAEIAIYYAATKTLALVSFIYYSVGAASAHRFSQYHVAGEQEKLASFIGDTIRWTFWPSLALSVVLLVAGKPILSLFGPGFADGYPLMCVLVIGLLARASVGPSERLLNMVGEQFACAMVYAAAFATNLILCLLLIPRLGLFGAACATATAIVVESSLLFLVVKWRLGLRVFVFSALAKG